MRLEIRLLLDSESRLSMKGSVGSLLTTYPPLHSVMNLHMNRATEQQAVGEIDIEKMKRYITYCKR